MTGMLLRAREAIIGVYTFFMLPLMFLSSAFIQPGFLPGWMQAIASRNPLNWEVQIGRAALSASPDWSAVAVRCGGLLILALIAVAISVTHLPQLREERLARSNPKAGGRYRSAVPPSGRSARSRGSRPAVTAWPDARCRARRQLALREGDNLPGEAGELPVARLSAPSGIFREAFRPCEGSAA